jgi:hypothetical protein
VLEELQSVVFASELLLQQLDSGTELADVGDGLELDEVKPTCHWPVPVLGPLAQYRIRHARSE